MQFYAFSTMFFLLDVAIIIRPQRQLAMAAYCYTRSSVVCLFVCLSVNHKEPCFAWGRDPSREGASLG